MQPRAFVATLVLATLLAGCASKASSGYPDQYLLQAEELPEGLKLSEIPPEMESYGFSKNPAEVPSQFLEGLGDEFQGFAPDKVWLELIEKTTSSSEQGADGGLMIASGFWTDAEKAKAAVDEIKSQADSDACAEASDEAAAMLRDENVIVIIGGDESMKDWVPKVVDALKEKAPGLASVC